MKTHHFFAGGNTARGFISRFEDVLPIGRQKRMYYVKGGPGVGKSTFMRRVGECAEKAGLSVEYFYCSSDPDSLDAIALPERGFGMMDGTAPHVYDPVVPGARDTLLSLGDFLDEKGLRPHLPELQRIQGEISARFGRCYRFLAAGREVWAASACGVESAEKARALAAKWGEALPLRGGGGSVRRLFGAAYTPKGLVDLTGRMGAERVFSVECPQGCFATGLMARMSEMAASRGLHAVELLHPLDPSQLYGVLIPAHGLLFKTVPQAAQGDDAAPAEALFDLRPAKDGEQSFDRNAFELLSQRAVEQLSAAKALHDELEKPYREHMDFARWQGALDGVLDELAAQDHRL